MDSVNGDRTKNVCYYIDHTEALISKGQQSSQEKWNEFEYKRDTGEGTRRTLDTEVNK